MRTRLRFYWFDDDGTVQPLPVTTYERLWEGRERKPEFAGRTVPLVEIVLLMDGRKVKAVTRVATHKLRFRPNGAIDAKYRDMGNRLALEAALGDEIGHPTKVKSLAGKIAQKRFTREFKFELTPAQQRTLREVIWRS